MPRLPVWLLLPCLLLGALSWSALAPARAPAGPEAGSGCGLVALQFGDGRRLCPVPDPRGLPGRLQLQFAAAWAGQTIELCARRTDAAGAAVPEWRLRPIVRQDGTLPMAGLPAGCYALRAIAAGTGVARGAAVLGNGREDVAVAMIDETAAPR